jgi:hypothetical protein
MLQFFYNGVAMNRFPVLSPGIDSMPASVMHDGLIAELKCETVIADPAMNFSEKGGEE